jgi:hypothetical protein
MLYMVIEHFKNSDASPVYERFREKGRMMPEGLNYVSSWTETSGARCFQVMECDDAKLFDLWTSNWSDLTDFEIVPVLTGQEMAKKMMPPS